MQETRKRALSLPFVKLNTPGVAKFVSEPFDDVQFWLIGHQDKAMLQTATTSASDLE